jgi:hypothetical protein
MVADIARVTYDPSRQYRSPVWQQGRVALEADNNEAVTLQTEALRLETIDIVGPLGTPNKGFALGAGAGPGGVTIGAGTLYLGGWRLENPKTFDLSTQPDWLDAPAFTATSGDFVVSLLLTETTVTAFEDRALREVALGGPDTAARVRLMQRYLRLASGGATCATGATSVAALLTADGVTLDSKTLELHSTARLRAGFATSASPADVCLPQASGGYLGADNQLVRVTVTSYDSTKKTGALLWGWNNASLIYRASIGADGATITLIDTPVDFEHAPQQNQVVELLRTAKDFGRDNYVAELEGDVVPTSPTRRRFSCGSGRGRRISSQARRPRWTRPPTSPSRSRWTRCPRPLQRVRSGASRYDPRRRRKSIRSAMPILLSRRMVLANGSAISESSRLRHRARPCWPIACRASIPSPIRNAAVVG